MENTQLRKVKFIYGNNERYDYYILAEREEIQIKENELAYIMTNESKTNIVSFNNICGNFDFLLQRTNKDVIDFLGYELVDSDEIEFE